MGTSALLRPLAGLWSLFGTLALLAALFSFSLGEGHLAGLFMASALLSGVPGLMILTATRGMRVSASAVDAVLLALIAWSTTPAFAALPFYLSGYFSQSDAFFEAYSAVTTTGAVLLPAEELPRSLVLWRALLSWMGGYATLMLAAAIFAALDKDLPAIRRSSLLTIRPDNVFSHLRLAAQRIGLLYVVITAIAGIAIMMAGESLFDASILAMGAISTGGYAPFSGPLLGSLGPVVTFLMALTCLIGALNISLFWDALRDRSAFRDPDLAGLAALVAGVGLLFYISEPENPLRHAADALFVVSTAGYTTASELSAAPLAALFAALIGGAAASTTGGVKISRILMLWKRMGTELAVLADPSSVAPVTFRDRAAPDRSLLSVWSYVLAFAAVLGFGTIVLAIAGTAFEQSFGAVAAALANAGPLYITMQEDQNWSDLSEAARTWLIPVMILGRLEVLAALTAIAALVMRR
ncbi:potassium transporter TrkG [Maricaulis sp.]|uniref:potassium transporter TrkG n=1 Tax=Maricaulis sp. TaxID=1486257 RepID=UPI0026270698|nr:potassium transporter TrkG [Maricaulis sp.]